MYSQGSLLCLTTIAMLIMTGFPAMGYAQVPHAPLHSASHPLTAPPPNPNSYTVTWNTAQAPIARVAEGDAWAIYSRAVNQITCVAQQGDITWLGTNLGVKCVDKQNRTVRHYTRLDGLPEDRVTAIAADTDTVWCAVPIIQNGAATVSLCRLDRKTGHWETVRRTPRRVIDPTTSTVGFNAGVTINAPFENTTIVVTPEFVCFAAGPVPREATALLQLYDKRLHTWQEIACDLPLHAERTYLNIAFVDIDRYNVWVGTNLGLLRYRLIDRKWQRFLPNHSCYAGGRRGENGWLTAYIEDPKLAEGGRWLLTRFGLRTGDSKEYTLPIQITRSAYAPASIMAVPTGVSVQEGTVWVSLWTRYNQNAFCCLDAKTEQFRIVQATNQQEMARVPDAAFCQPTLPRSTLMISLAPYRFWEWFCAEPFPTAVASYGSDSAQVEEPGGAVSWTIDNGNALARKERSSGRVEHFPLTGFVLPLQPNVQTLALANDTLFVRTEEGLHAYSLQTETWRKIKTPPDNTGFYNARLIAQDDRLWIGTANSTLEYDPKTRQFGVVFASQRYYRLLGITTEGAWLANNSNALFHVTPQNAEPEPVRLSPPPDQQENAILRLLGMTGHTVWYEVTPQPIDKGRVIAGYDIRTKSWTPAQPIKNSVQIVSFLADGASTVLTTSEEKAPIQRYDAATHTWSVLVAKPPDAQGVIPSSYSLAAMNDAHIWCREMGQIRMWDYDRKTGEWAVYHCPDNSSWWGQQTADITVKHGDTLYMASNAGVWSFHLLSHTWTRLPGIGSQAYSLQQITGDSQAIWALGSSNRGYPTFAARFDKATQQWTTYTKTEGFPEEQSISRLVTDGESAWAFGGAEAYRLDRRTNRWHSISSALGNSPNAHVAIQDIAADGDHVWLLTGDVSTARNADAKPPRIGMLARYDRATGKFTLLDPKVDEENSGLSMLVEKETIWLGTQQGIYRYDKAANTWGKLDRPDGFPAISQATIHRIARADGALWFFSTSSIVRWTGP